MYLCITACVSVSPTESPVLQQQCESTETCQLVVNGMCEEDAGCEVQRKSAAIISVQTGGGGCHPTAQTNRNIHKSVPAGGQIWWK